MDVPAIMAQTRVKITKTIESFEKKISRLKKMREKNSNGAKFYKADLEKEIEIMFNVKL